ncbi:MAG TPA: MFS transporter [Anaeromyxobacter sp.]|nr:MFS transporter [Anaeromyxobacter sp.]
MAEPTPSAVPAAVPWWREPTRAQWTNYGAAWAGWVLDGFDFCIFLFAMRPIAREFGVQLSSTALSVTLTLLVRLLGGLLAGWLADRHGRRLPLMLSILWFAACDGAVYFADSFTAILVLRTLFGFGMGAEWTAGSALAMESWPARSRGLASGVLQGSFGIGYVLAAVAYAAVGEENWRTLFLIAAAPALLVIPIRLLVKETRPASPHTPVNEPAPEPGEAAAARLFRRRVVWGSVLYALSFAVYYALVGNWAAMLQRELSLPATALPLPTLLFQLGMLVGAAAIGAAASRFGVVRAQVVPLLLLLPALPLYVGAAGVGAGLWAGAALAGLLGAGISGVTPYLFAALFPAEVRARGFALVYHVGALFGGLTPFLVAWLAETAPMPLRWALAGAAALAALLVVGMLAVRPRGILPPDVLGRSPVVSAPATARRAL